jgi:hypothetical protein
MTSQDLTEVQDGAACKGDSIAAASASSGDRRSVEQKAAAAVPAVSTRDNAGCIVHKGGSAAAWPGKEHPGSAEASNENAY